MPRAVHEPGALIRRMWRTLSPWPGGKACFSAMFGLIVPYTGTIRPRILELDRGHARVALSDRRGIRNHLDSIHAIALANLAEAASGLAMAYSQPERTRAIITRFDVAYLKKGRGPLMADCRFEVPDFSEQKTHELTVEIRDEAQDLVARGVATWLVGPQTKG